MANNFLMNNAGFATMAIRVEETPSYLFEIENLLGRRRGGGTVGSTGGGAAPPAAAPTATVPAATVTASDLQVIIASIPTAQDGHVITADTHNTMVFALRALASRLGVSAGSSGISIMNAPRFRKKAAVAEWEADVGFVKKTTSTTAAAVHGWMEMELPQGGRILSMAVFGTKKGTGTLKLRLGRQQISDVTIFPTLIELVVPDDNDATKPLEADVTLPGLGAGTETIAEYRQIDNDKHKYLVTADIEGGDTATTAQINAIRIACGF